VRQVRKVCVPEFIAQFAFHDLPILNRSDEVVLGAAKMLADGVAIVGNGSDFLSYSGCHKVLLL
jgi:hypothetical protein